jgi:hypothetical protein
MGGPLPPHGGPGLRPSFAADHAAMGIRCHEFHGLSHLAEFVHPAVAVRLQQLWDGVFPGGPNRWEDLGEREGRWQDILTFISLSSPHGR